MFDLEGQRRETRKNAETVFLAGPPQMIRITSNKNQNVQIPGASLPAVSRTVDFRK